ncbi:1-acyl-sn-glycerol-3-phosphate acyltransferase [Streptomyces sp. NPDC002537]
MTGRPAAAAGPWRPASPCGRGCLPTGPRPAGRVRQALRIGVFLLLLAQFPWLALTMLAGHRASARAYRWFMRAVLRAVGVHWTARGTDLPTTPVAPLVVGNHTSWLDAVLLPAALPVRLVARADLLRWPVIGWFAAVGRSIPVDRDRLSTLPDSVRRITAALRAGEAVAVFPEGTTWCGAASGPYRPAAFQAALDAGAAVRPVLLRYRAAGPATTAAAFVGPMSAAESLRNVVATRGLTAEVIVLPPLPPHAAPDRRSLAALAERAVDDRTPAAHRCRARRCSVPHTACARPRTPSARPARRGTLCENRLRRTAMSSTYETLTEALVTRIGIDPERLAPDRTFGELALDSMAVVELAVAMDGHTEAPLPLENLAGLTLAEAAALLDAAGTPEAAGP